MKFFGVDGCKRGWFFVGLDDDDKYLFGIITSFAGNELIFSGADLVLVDIPIGLREIDTKERLCDLEARKILGIRASSVFPSPSRLSFDYSDYIQSSSMNFQSTGRKLSKQTYVIMKKIYEVDEFIRSGNNGIKIREMHPEVCFWGLNGSVPMKFNKKKSEGKIERRKLLSKYYARSEELIEEAKNAYKRKDLAEDDIIDALAGAVTARQIENLCTLPLSPEKDLKGLKMEMVFVK